MEDVSSLTSCTLERWVAALAHLWLLGHKVELDQLILLGQTTSSGGGSPGRLGLQRGAHT